MRQIIISSDVPTLHDYSFMGFFFVSVEEKKKKA